MTTPTSEKWTVEGNGGMSMDGRRGWYYLRAGNRSLIGAPLTYEEAHMMAAADDLLEACELALTYLHCYCTSEWRCANHDVREVLQLAIVKARGTREEDNTP